jgi:ABC-type branched-subunit amino acid transport system ATPase component
MTAIEIKLKNVRCIETATIQLRPGKIATLVGANNSGKTTVLDVVVGLIRALPGGQIMQINTDVYREVERRFLRPEAEVVIPTALVGDNAIFRETGLVHVHYLAALSQGVIDAGRPTMTSWAIDKVDVAVQGSSAPLIRSTASGRSAQDLASPGKHLECDPTAMTAGPFEPIGSGRQVNWTNCDHGLFYGPAPQSSPFVNGVRPIARRVYYLPAARTPAFPATSANAGLQGDGPASTGVLLRLHLKQEHWRTFNTALSLIFEDVEEVVFDEIGDHPAPHAVFSHGARVPFDRMGFGFRNCVAVLAEICAAPKNAIVVIDEPEQGLNQAAQRQLSTVIDGLRADVTLVVGTQSEAFCRGLSTDSLHLAARQGPTSRISPCNLTVADERRDLARAMGVDPLLLLDDGKIIYVEGISDEMVISEWLKLHFGASKRGCIVQALGGGDKLNETFAQPMFRTFKDRLFFIIDADGSTAVAPHSDQTRRRLEWINRLECAHFVLKRRELENYIGHTALAVGAKVNEAQLRPPEGVDESWIDFKEQVKAALGTGVYDERRITVGAFNALSTDDQRNLFKTENAALLEAIKRFAPA